MSGQEIESRPYKTAQAREASAAEKAYAPSVEAMRIGLRNYTQLGGKGDLVVFLTQARIGNNNEETPCMVIANRHQPRERHVFIPLNHLWRMLDPQALKTVAPNLAEHLYGYVTKDDLFRIVDLMFNFAEDLKNAPPPRVMHDGEFMEASAKDGFTFMLNDRKVNA